MTGRGGTVLSSATCAFCSQQPFPSPLPLSRNAVRLEAGRPLTRGGLGEGLCWDLNLAVVPQRYTPFGRSSWRSAERLLAESR
jgi:hypothetical protein